MAADRIPILLYHGVGPPAGDRFTVSVARFARHLDAVVASGRSAYTIGALTARRPMPASAVAITFDDGTADFAAHAWPLLRERGLSATLFVTSGLVGGAHLGRPMLDWEQLRALRDEGVQIGAHAHRHVALDVLPPHDAARELVTSKLVLEDALQVEIDTFAYPFGYHTALVKRLAARAGFRAACAVRNALSHPDDDRFALARMMITADTTGAQIAALMDGRGPVAAPRELTRTRAWRLYRRIRSTRLTVRRIAASAAVSGSRSNV
jgi:peptidoglycan/xylan/chitin deacetylase (PgdA/CDA1 family)